jgi:hypothetical protein
MSVKETRPAIFEQLKLKIYDFQQYKKCVGMEIFKKITIFQNKN